MVDKNYHSKCPEVPINVLISSIFFIKWIYFNHLQEDKLKSIHMFYAQMSEQCMHVVGEIKAYQLQARKNQENQLTYVSGKYCSHDIYKLQAIQAQVPMKIKHDFSNKNQPMSIFLKMEIMDPSYKLHVYSHFSSTYGGFHHGRIMYILSLFQSTLSFREKLYNNSKSQSLILLTKCVLTIATT